MRTGLVLSLVLFLSGSVLSQELPGPRYILHWGGTGSLPGEFFEPADLDVAPDGTVYVVDRGNHRVQRFTADGAFLLSWSQAHPGGGEFGNPTGIDIDPSGLVVVADRDWIETFTPEGGFEGNFRGPTYHIAAEAGEIYGAYWDSVFVKSTSGQLLRGWRVQQASSGSLDDVCLFPDGRLAVTWPFQDLVFVMDRDGGNQTAWGSGGTFGRPNAVASDGEFVYVADLGREQVVVLSLEGEEITAFPVTVPGFGTLRPRSLAFDSEGELFVLTDAYVVKYAPPTAVEATTWSKIKTLFQ